MSGKSHWEENVSLADGNKWRPELAIGFVYQGRLDVGWKTGSKSVFERRLSTGSDAFSFIIWLDATKFVLLSFFTLIKTIWRKRKPLPTNGKRSTSAVDVRRSKTFLLKLPTLFQTPCLQGFSHRNFLREKPWRWGCWFSCCVTSTIENIVCSWITSLRYGLFKITALFVAKLFTRREGNPGARVT